MTTACIFLLVFKANLPLLMNNFTNNSLVIHSEEKAKLLREVMAKIDGKNETLE